MFIQNLQPINLDRFAAINAIEASSRVSDKYKFIPTTQALSVLAEHGWFPVQARQAGTRIAENQGFQKHVIRLSNDRFNTELMVGEVLPQLMLTNSHSGTSAFELSAALYRKVCSNGLCVSDASLGSIRVRHIGYDDQNMSLACDDLVKALPGVLTEVESFKQLELSNDEKVAFAKAAIEMRFDGDTYSVEPSHILRPRRSADTSNDLFTTFNVVQEHIIRGGVRQTREDGSRIRSREVKNIDANLKFNRALWTLQSEMAKLKAA